MSCTMPEVQENKDMEENRNEEVSKPENCGEGKESADDSEDKTTDVGNGQIPEGMSKRQMKRIKKHEQWLKLKAEKRKEEKLKKKRKFAAQREKGELGPSRKALKKNSMQHSSCKVKVVLDCSFDDFMSEKDVRHLVQQIQHSYSCNRRADNPLQFYVCGLNGKTEERLNQIGDYKGWDVYMKSEGYLEMFPPESVVYLSSDSPTVLQELSEDKVYVIGGLVDHNHHKGLCHKLAEEKGVSHAQLPITEYIDMKTRKVLTVNHVFEILLRYTESQDWKKAFFQVLPLRKGVKELEEADVTGSPPSENDSVSMETIGNKCTDSEQCNTENTADSTGKTADNTGETQKHEETPDSVQSDIVEPDSKKRETTPGSAGRETTPCDSKSVDQFDKS